MSNPQTPQGEGQTWEENTVYGPSTVIAALDQIEALVEQARAVPLSASIMVNRAELLDLLGGGAQVVLGLCRKPNHEVELQRRPAKPEDLRASGQNLLVGYVLIDDVAQALCAGFRRQGKTGAADILDFAQQLRP